MCVQITKIKEVFLVTLFFFLFIYLLIYLFHRDNISELTRNTERYANCDTSRDFPDPVESVALRYGGSEVQMDP